MKDFLKDAEVKKSRQMTQELSSTYGHPISLGSHVNQWDVFVRECETGYGLSIDDYTNGLNTREMIQKMIETASLTLAAKTKSQVELIDDRFLRATIPVTNHLMEVSNENEPTEMEKMLYFRIPKKCEASLKEKLQNLNILSGTPSHLPKPLD